MTGPPVSFLLGALALAAATPTVTPTPGPARSGGPTFCAEWIRQTRQGYERLTLFTDRMVVWKTSGGGGPDDVRRKAIASDEADFYCEYFTRDEFWGLPADLRSGLSGDSLAGSRVTLVRPDGSRKAIRFDELSSFSPPASALKASLEGLRALFTSKLAPAGRFTAETLPPGTLLRRFDGVFFRVRRILSDKGVVELEGVSDPISYYLRLSEMRYQFPGPE